MLQDYIAREIKNGTQPPWPENLRKRYIRPVERANGIDKNIRWHTFRHTYGTLLKANGEDVKTVQELLRHANSRITLEVYTPAVTSHKRAAQSKVVRMMVPSRQGATRAQTGWAMRRNLLIFELNMPLLGPDWIDSGALL